ncbi:unnamed protein product, partial [Symbiodinium sp. KB8]
EMLELLLPTRDSEDWAPSNLDPVTVMDISPNRLYREQEWHYCDRESCQSPRTFQAEEVWLWKSDKNAGTIFTTPLQEFAELYEHNSLAGGQGVSEASPTSSDSSGYWSP